MSVIVDVDANPLAKVTIKTTPQMALKAIVVQACERLKLDTPDQYILKSKKTTLDLSLSVRFANLAPGAKLTLVRRGISASNATVTVALQVDQGGRHIDAFPVSTTLWEILLHFEAKAGINLTRQTGEPVANGDRIAKALAKLTRKTNEVYIMPVCVFTNQEYNSIEKLKATSLLDAGLEGGSCLIRVLRRYTDEPIEAFMPLIDSVVPKRETIVTPVNPVNPVEPVEPVEPVNPVNPVNPVEPVQPVESIESVVALDLLVFLPPPKDVMPKQIELPDSFFRLSPAEMKALVGSQQARSRQLQDAPLMTRAMREREEELKRQKHPKTRIRVRFPNRYTVQANFWSGERVSSLYKAIESVVSSERKFVLYVTPPHQNLDENVSFWDSKLAPASLVYFNWADGQIDGEFLTKEALSLARPFPTETNANAVITPLSNAETPNAETLMEVPQKRSILDSFFPASPKAEKKQFPKWFKPVAK